MKEIKRLKYDAVVVGSGASGYAAALSLAEGGLSCIALITECRCSGTSRNTGSDKQTYYKLSLSGDTPDSPLTMANDLFSYGAVDGDTAMCEAAGSARAFMRLSLLGVPFPTDGYGAYVGYKTDHDARARATSAGPLTSKYMTEALEREVSRLGVEAVSGLRVIEVLKNEERALGLLAIDNDGGLCAIDCPNIIFATGGAASLYADTVYPESQLGATGTLARAGIALQNLTEWQYGLASLNPRWNVSGTYMQSLPSFVSVDDAGEERYFLEEFYEGRASDGLTAVFLKGYEWPFDSRKLCGSSVIDLLVYRERALGRRVYLDYTREPFGGVSFSELSAEARDYLSSAGAVQNTPIERLIRMNLPAYELYLSRGVDLKHRRLEISLCAQHHNGGACVDSFWQSTLSGLFVVGEAAGTHGVYRPGGSALNAGQVGAYRAASYVLKYPEPHSEEELEAALSTALAAHTKLLTLVCEESNLKMLFNGFTREMSDIAGAVRDSAKIAASYEKTKATIASIADTVKISSEGELYDLYIYVDMLYARLVTLAAMADFSLKANGGSRGSALYICEDGTPPTVGLEALSYKAAPDLSDMIQEVRVENGAEVKVSWRRRREIPTPDGFFENVWREWRECGGVYARQKPR